MQKIILAGLLTVVGLLITMSAMSTMQVEEQVAAAPLGGMGGKGAHDNRQSAPFDTVGLNR